MFTLALCIGLALRYWNYLHDDQEPLSSTVRNMSLIIGGIVAIELALWRSLVGERQTAVAQRQAETAQRDLLNQQFQKGAEMLGSSVLSVRLGGIYALRHLAIEHPEQYHVQVMEQLCAYVRGANGVDGQLTAVKEKHVVTREEYLTYHPEREDLPNEWAIERFRARDDIQEAMNAIAFCHDGNLKIETEQNYWLNLAGADLRGLVLSDMNLSRAPWNFIGSTSFRQKLAISLRTDMRRAKLHDALLLGTNLSRVDLSEATGLTEFSLRLAYNYTDEEPRLSGVIDDNTGKPIVWHELTDDE